jgi:hypothetical protein
MESKFGGEIIRLRIFQFVDLALRGIVESRGDRNLASAGAIHFSDPGSSEWRTPSPRRNVISRDVADILERGLMGRVVDEDVDAAEVIDHLLDDLVAMPRVLQVAGYENGLAAFLLQEFLDLVRLLVSFRKA